MVTKRVTLRCYARPRWSTKKVYAECIDLDLIVIRDSSEEAYYSLNEAVIGYLEAADKKGWLNELVPRRSPLSHRLVYQGWRFICFLTYLLQRNQCKRPSEFEARKDISLNGDFQVSLAYA